MDLSTAFKQLRNELNMTQQDLADMLQTNVSTVNRWEQRKNKPTRAMSLLIMKIAEEKGVSKVCLNNLKENLLPRENIKAGINDLRHAEIDRINQLLNNSANGVVVFGIESHDILYANNKALQFVGCSFEDGKKMKCYEFFMKKDKVCDFCDSCCMKDEQEEGEWEYTSPLTERHYLIRGKKMEWNRQAAQIQYITDITENYKLQDVLKHNQKVFDYALRFANVRVFEFDIQKKRANLISDFNDVEFFPHHYENYPQSFLEEGLIPEEFIEQYKEMMQEVCNGKKQSETTIQVKGLDGELHWMKYRMNLVDVDKDGQPLNAVCSVQIVDDLK